MFRGLSGLGLGFSGVSGRSGVEVERGTCGTVYTQYPLQEIQLQEPVLEFGEKLETTSTEILRLRDIKIAGNEF